MELAKPATEVGFTVTFTTVGIRQRLSGVKVYAKVPTEIVEIVEGDQTPVIPPELEGNDTGVSFWQYTVSKLNATGHWAETKFEKISKIISKL